LSGKQGTACMSTTMKTCTQVFYSDTTVSVAQSLGDHLAKQAPVNSTTRKIQRATATTIPTLWPIGSSGLTRRTFTTKLSLFQNMPIHSQTMKQWSYSMKHCLPPMKLTLFPWVRAPSRRVGRRSVPDIRDSKVGSSGYQTTACRTPRVHLASARRDVGTRTVYFKPA
jgi:hypothetical protein